MYECLCTRYNVCLLQMKSMFFFHLNFRPQLLKLWTNNGLDLFNWIRCQSKLVDTNNVFHVNERLNKNWGMIASCIVSPCTVNGIKHYFTEAFVIDVCTKMKVWILFHILTFSHLGMILRLFWKFCLPLVCCTLSCTYRNRYSVLCCLFSNLEYFIYLMIKKITKLVPHCLV